MGVLSTDHDHETCDDPDCARYICKVYKEGYQDGYEDGSASGYAEGYADGAASADG
jgi:hypothetical protein